TNCYLLCDEKSRLCALIDPGDEAGRIIRAVEDSGYTPRAILLTHGHYDHTGAVEDLLRRWPGLPVYLNHADTPAGGAAKGLFPPLPDTISYHEGDTVTVGGLTVEVLSTPGHSKGSVTLRCEDALFTGDTLFADDCGRTDLRGGDMNEMLRSLGRLGRLPGDYHVLPGHMEFSTLDRERRVNPWLNRGMALADGETAEAKNVPARDNGVL
ncbi:MAG: MBL fold metallo-hydrolase, partial [Oscillibacter sp.]|nr:MBL fold metallo-hydrolase [Oscillibacter sp.]